MSKQITQLEFVKSWFEANAGRYIHHSESKPALEEGWLALTGKRLEDADRAIRRLHQEKVLLQSPEEKGLYAWNDDLEAQKKEDFSDFLKESIRARDGYKCVNCAEPNSLDRLHVVFVKTPVEGGKAILSNGQTLCGNHALILELTRSKALAKQVLNKVLGTIYDDNGSLLVDKSYLERLMAAISSDSSTSIADLEKLLS
jgi:hypothetical protein